jgi:hypothetical protein
LRCLIKSPGNLYPFPHFPPSLHLIFRIRKKINKKKIILVRQSGWGKWGKWGKWGEELSVEFSAFDKPNYLMFFL